MRIDFTAPLSRHTPRAPLAPPAVAVAIAGAVAAVHSPWPLLLMSAGDNTWNGLSTRVSSRRE